MAHGVKIYLTCAVGLYFFAAYVHGANTRFTRETNTTKLPKVLVKDSQLPVAGLKVLENKAELLIIPEGSSAAQILEIAKKANGIDGIIWSGHEPPTNELLDAAGKSLKIFATASTGYDHLPLAELKKRELLVSNTPGVLAPAVAEIAVLLTLGAARRLEEGRRKIVDGEWKTEYLWVLGQDLVGSTVGIVGFGQIGSRIAKRLIPFEVGQIVYNAHSSKPEADAIGAKFVTLDTLLRESDFVISAVPLTNETRGMFNKTAFDKMKKSAIFVNIARGGVVQQDDLVEALKTNQIFAAGLDVMTPEPLPSDHALVKLPNCVLTPHLGSATIKTRVAMLNLASKNVLAALEGKPLPTPVKL